MKLPYCRGAKLVSCFVDVKPHEVHAALLAFACNFMLMAEYYVLRPVRDARIDVDVMRHNLACVRELCPNSRVMAMIKADGYGSIREIGAGESVGYNARWTSQRPSKIGTIGIGYGDGYPRHASSGTPVRIRDGLCPLIGQVSMDSLTIDLTDRSDVCVGDEAMLWGPALSVSAIVNFVGAIPYELLTSVQQRAPREWYSLNRPAAPTNKPNQSGIPRGDDPGRRCLERALNS